MFLNELSTRKDELTRINQWLTDEFGFSVENPGRAELRQAKKQLAESVDVLGSRRNAHKNPKYLKLAMMQNAVDIMLEEADQSANPNRSDNMEPNENTERMISDYFAAAEAHDQVSEAPAESDEEMVANFFEGGAAEAEPAAAETPVTESDEELVANFFDGEAPAEQPVAESDEQLVAAYFGDAEPAIVNEENEKDVKDKAEILLATQNMADKLTDMAGTIAKMRTEELMALTDEIKIYHSKETADSFDQALAGAFDQLEQALKGAKDVVSDQVSMFADPDGTAGIGSDMLGGEFGMEDGLDGMDGGLDGLDGGFPDMPEGEIEGPVSGEEGEAAMPGADLEAGDAEPGAEGVPPLPDDLGIDDDDADPLGREEKQ